MKNYLNLQKIKVTAIDINTLNTKISNLEKSVSANSNSINEIKSDYVKKSEHIYSSLAQKPRINGVELDGDKTAEELGIVSAGGDAVSFIVNAEFTIDDDDKWVVSNLSETFADISQAIADKKNVELHVYPQGVDNTAYVLIPNMVTTAGIAFNLVVAENTSLTGFTVMILPDNTVNSSMTDIDTEVDIIDDASISKEST